MFGISIIINITGIPAFKYSFHLPVLPHIIPNIANSIPDIPTVGLSAHIGSQLAATAIT